MIFGKRFSRVWLSLLSLLALSMKTAINGGCLPGEAHPLSAPLPPQVRFTDITAAAGINFVHVNGAAGEKLLPETMGSGCAFLDFDADGDQDLLLINSSPWNCPFKGLYPTMKLYENDGSGTFKDITIGSGLDISFYGMGVAVGDYDNDGLPDVF